MTAMVAAIMRVIAVTMTMTRSTFMKLMMTRTITVTKKTAMMTDYVDADDTDNEDGGGGYKSEGRCTTCT